MEAELTATEAKVSAKKRAVAEEAAKLKTAQEEDKIVESKLKEARNRLKSLSKEMEELKTEKASGNKENVADK